MLNKPDMNKPAFVMYPNLAKRVGQGICATCDTEIKETDFTSELSKKEYSISGMCQECQDVVFKR